MPEQHKSFRANFCFPYWALAPTAKCCHGHISTTAAQNWHAPWPELLGAWAQTNPALHGLHFLQTYLAGEPHHHLSLFKVGLPVEVGSFQVADAILVRGVQQQDVSWDGLVTPQLHEIPHVDIFPAFLNISTFFPDALKTCQNMLKTCDTRRQAFGLVNLLS